jgi:cytochrome c-type biogenesis protein CcmF
MNTIATIGFASLLTALGTSSFAVVASIAGLRGGNAALVEAARRAVMVNALFVGTAAAALLTALLRNDFSIAYVANVSSLDLVTPMKVAAFYSSQAGSLLFWTLVTSVMLAAFAHLTAPTIPWGMPHAIAAGGLVLVAFLVPLVFMASPFTLSEAVLTDGQGLNPLLVDKGMLVHPPMLLGGLASTAVPFVLGVAALASGRLDGAWIRVVRPWAVFSWLILSVGNVLGGWWAYTVLGWGGYWGWDPVENSAILPLLPLTAFLHSIMVQERRGMLKLWNLALAFSAFALAVFGTFNVRSGLVASVHSFAQSSIGPYFLILLALTLAASIGLLIWRAPRLRADSDFVSLASRDAVMVVNNYTLVAIALVVLGGTLFPVFSELINGTRITVGPAFYNEVVGPLLIVLLVLVVLGTVLPWRRASSATMVARLRAPLAVAVIATLALAALGMRDPFAFAGVVSAIAIGHVTLREFYLGTRAARRASTDVGPGAWTDAALGLLDRDPRRYGGYVVHLALAVMAIAVVGSNIYQQQLRVNVRPGEQFEMAGYTFVYAGLRERPGTENGIESEVTAAIRVLRNGEEVTTLEPGRRFFRNFPGQPSAVVGLHSSLRQDLYSFVEGWDDTQQAQLQVIVNPLVAWLWIGAAFYTAGGLVVLVPVRAPAAARNEARARVVSGVRP